MSHRPLLSTLLLLALPAGCADADIDAEPGAAVEVRDSAGISVVENGASGGAPLLTLSPQPTFDVGSLAAEGPEQLHRVAAATSLADGSVAVLDGGSGEVRVFAPDGAFVRTLGGETDELDLEYVRRYDLVEGGES